MADPRIRQQLTRAKFNMEKDLSDEAKGRFSEIKALEEAQKRSDADELEAEHDANARETDRAMRKKVADDEPAFKRGGLVTKLAKTHPTLRSDGVHAKPRTTTRGAYSK